MDNREQVRHFSSHRYISHPVKLKFGMKTFIIGCFPRIVTPRKGLCKTPYANSTYQLHLYKLNYGPMNSFFALDCIIISSAKDLDKFSF